MKYKIEKNVYLAQPEIKTKQDEKQLLSSTFFKYAKKSKICYLSKGGISQQLQGFSTTR